MLYGVIEAESAGLAERQSLRWMWNEFEYEGNYFGDVPDGGAYTHIPPGASPTDADLLGEPVGGRLLFAGEHPQSARMAYADGAMSSGIREAKRLLGLPSVRLGPASAGHT